ncbi:hypothetical protein GCM10017771_86990 [Streptomyces capitiformicae]|uniref:Uncharacterized protein n=1 Tax=Streptomyces capitiformicae TaxID=2014920 RepID=A0A918ZR13_9ACTN|nr:hypothetical protein GCM10017771_86990 [Streptomyces capitiformicae]
MVVVAAPGPEEGGPAGYLVLDGEAEHLAVEGDRTFDITDEQDSMVEPAYGHRAPIPLGSAACLIDLTELRKMYRSE